ncbi:sugar phosphate isomerase/epimerase family protein [Paenibacillus sp. GCM10023248]|uniref:sugar phosphate isomerase/epimerase family protein n=1 Tax=Bacillales TaxID=1385 RepID=UPI002378E966|nr:MULTISPECIES: sugar phosphate isomerase/epimerase family protein [Bacillales]MDD9268310.1 sugar phosphate isomerase/epimerase [Paenibacillus sp. MAHUQ-63]MDR6879990.1 sugar phosphate isomerase/epimerase [Bacillus sp. 3255]
MKATIVLGGNMYDDSTIEHFLQDAAAIGYEGVEIRGVGELKDGHIPQERAEQIKAMLDSYKLTPTNLSLFAGGFACNTEEENEEEVRKWARYLDFAATIGCGMMRLNPGFVHSAEASKADYAKAVRRFQQCADMAGERHIRAVIEMHHGTLCDTADASIAFLESVGRSNVGLILDPVNLYQVPTEYGISTIERLKPYLFNVHIKDIVELKGSEYPWAFGYSDYVPHIGRYHRVIPKSCSEEERYFCHRLINQGGIDWYEVFRGLERIAYSGYLTIESVSKPGSDLPAHTELARQCYNDLQHLLQITADKGVLR